MEKHDIMYGVRKTEKGYFATKPDIKEEFEFHIVNGGHCTTAGHSVRILDSHFADPLVSNGWKYHVSYGNGCIIDNGYSYGISIEKNCERIGVQIAEDFCGHDGLDFNSVFASIMISIATRCKTVDDVEHLISDYQLPIGSFNKSIDWYKKEAESGNIEVQMALARMYAKGNGIKEDRQKAMEWYTKAADAGDTGALLKIADFYAEKAVLYYQKAASCGITKAMKKLAEFYYRSGDYVNAGTWYRKLNDHGHYNNMVGNCYYELKCYAEAVKYYSIGANNRDAEALFALSKCYSLGHGVPLDRVKADECFKAAIKAKKDKENLPF